MPLVNGWLLDTFADDLPKAYSNTAVILSRHTTIFTADAKDFLKNSKTKLNFVVNMHKDF